jgi:hypothetical protein
MTFVLSSTQGEAKSITVQVVSATNGREAEIAVHAAEALMKLAQATGGYVAVSGSGELNPSPGMIGDSINLQINSLLPPAVAVEDAGLASAAGSARNFPPEASTAAPMTEDQSPPAAQDPIPQPSVEVPGPAPEVIAEPASTLFPPGNPVKFPVQTFPVEDTFSDPVVEHVVPEVPANPIVTFTSEPPVVQIPPGSAFFPTPNVPQESYPVDVPAEDAGVPEATSQGEPPASAVG